MELTKMTDENRIVIAVAGRLDTMTAPQLEAEVRNTVGETDSLTLDFAALEYISSAGLRVLLGAKKAMDAKDGAFAVKNVNEAVHEVLEITGFTDILTIE